MFDLQPKNYVEVIISLNNLVVASRSENWQISDSCLLLSKSTRHSFVFTTNKIILFDRIFLLIWQISVSILKTFRLEKLVKVEKSERCRGVLTILFNSVCW